MEKGYGTLCSSICHKRKFGNQISQYNSSDNDMLKVGTVVHQIITELSEAVSGKVMVITKMVLNIMKQNCC
jgi:hypothetical protein